MAKNFKTPNLFPLLDCLDQKNSLSIFAKNLD